jgi:hypothetical protein
MEARVQDLEGWREYKADPAIATSAAHINQTAQHLAELSGMVKEIAPAVKAHADVFPIHCDYLSQQKADTRWRLGLWAFAAALILLALSAIILPHLTWK